MNLLSWTLAFSILIFLMIEAVSFHRGTVCRQVAWLKSSELMTRSLLTDPPSFERAWHARCKLRIVRQKDKITWQRLPSPRWHRFDSGLQGEL
jgi:hypothetical protein